MTWDSGAWDTSEWGGTILTRRSRGLTGIHLTIDGHPVKMDPDWSETEGPGGFDRFSARVPLDHIRRFSLGQESQAILYNDSGDVVWWGTLGRDPAVQGEVAFIEAEGPQAEAQRDAGRMLFQTRSYEVWQDRDSEPFVFGTPRNYSLSSDSSYLTLTAPRGEDFASGHADGFAMWAPGTPGGLQRYAFTIRRNRDQGGQDLRTQRFTGPSGTRTDITTHGLNTGETLTITRAITGGEDGLDLVMIADSTITQGQVLNVRILNLRVNGIWGNTGRAASYDTMYADEGIKDVFGRLGWGTTGLTQVNTNVLPLDWQGGSFLDLLDYLTLLVDHMWLGPLEPGGNGIFRPFGHKEWRIQKSRGANAELEKMKLYNEVVVPYVGVGGTPRQAVATPATDPLPGETRTFVADPLEDEQVNATLADTVAQTLADRLGVPRWRGRIDIVETDGDPYLIRPGDHIIEEDADSDEARTHRVLTVEKREFGVSVGIESDVTAGGLEGLNMLEGQRRLVKGRRPSKRQRRRTQTVRRKLTKRMRGERREFIESLEGLDPKKRRKRLRRYDRNNPLPVD